MRRQYAFVLSEAEPEQLAWLGLTAAMSVRTCDADADIVLVTDEATRTRWPAALQRHAAVVYSRVVAPSIPHPPGAIASRHLKTSLRQILDGDFLFLDVDTLMFETPLALFAGDHDLGAVPDRNWEHWRPHRPEWIAPHYARLGWSLSDRGYFNSGVLFLRDSPAARELGLAWHQRWQEFCAIAGKHQDQPALNSLVGAPRLAVRSFPLRFNAMVDAVPYFCRGAKIVHYFLHGASRLNPTDSLLWQLADGWRTTGEFDRARFAAHQRRRDPWVHPTRSVHIELATGHLLTALRVAGQRLLGR